MDSKSHATFLKQTQKFKGKPAKVRDIVPFFHNDEITMRIFSFLWTAA